MGQFPSFCSLSQLRFPQLPPSVTLIESFAFHELAESVGGQAEMFHTTQVYIRKLLLGGDSVKADSEITSDVLVKLE